MQLNALHTGMLLPTPPLSENVLYSFKYLLSE